VSWGAVIAVVLWVAASLLFRLYAANFGSYDETYGSLAAVVMLLLWLLITAFVVLLGAQINAEMEHQTTVDTTEGPDRPIGDRDATMADTVGAASE
jgi:membrane protein